MRYNRLEADQWWRPRRARYRPYSPRSSGGQGILSNGIVLSGTAHWLFDRGLIGLSDDLKVLISRHANDRDSIQGPINKTGRAIVPAAGAHQRPHPQLLRWQRENTFKQ
jgi:putative restriction endonuclease